MSKICPVCNGPVTDSDPVCPSCGFKLLGSTQAFKCINPDGTPAPAAPEAPAQQSAAPASAVSAAPEAPASVPAKRETVLTVVRGPQTGVAFVLEDRVLVIGRDPQCDIFLNDMTVSRDHAHIEPAGAAFQLVDDDSFNGVWVNEQNIRTALLHDGDFIQIGSFGLVVSVR